MSALDALDAAAAGLGVIAQRDVALGPYTTYRAGGPAAVFATINDESDLAVVARVAAETGVDVLVVGRGSNLLVADAGFGGLAVMLGDHFAAVEVADTMVTAGGAAALPIVARRSAAAGLTGFEWAVGVPGSVGGAVRMNAGGHGSDMAATLRRVRVVDLTSSQDGWMPASSLELSYRHSNLAAGQIVVAAELGLRAGDAAAGEAMIAEIVRWRREHQPGGANAGSVFTNPPDDSAGRLVEMSGGKGLRIGTAEVSTKHANFIQVDADGSADDVFALMGELQRRVEIATGVRLVPETRLVGFSGNSRVEVEGR